MKLSAQQKFLLFILDLFVFLLTVPIALFLRKFELNLNEIALHYSYFLPLSLLYVFVFFIFGLYEREVYLFSSRLLKHIILAQIVNVVLSVFVFFLLPEITPKLLLAIYFAVSSIGIYFIRKLLLKTIGSSSIGVLLIATGVDFAELAEEINEDKTIPLEIKAIAHPELLTTQEMKEIITRLEKNKDIQAIVVDLESAAVESILEFLEKISIVQQKLNLIDAQSLYEEVFERVPLDIVDERWVVKNIKKPSKLFEVYEKIVDIFFGILLGIVFALIFPFVYLAIKLEDGGDIFYTSKRVGKKGKVFKLLKFRTMTGKDSSKDALESKLKVTKVGRFLRRFRLDEIPQFVNLLKGHISFVGPRPEIDLLHNQYKKSIPFYYLKEAISPGLTGWAQVKHRHHPHHRINEEATKQKLSYDLYYLKNRGIFLNTKIILLSFFAVFFDKSRENIQNT